MKALARGGRDGGREACGGRRRRRVDLWGLKRISIHREEEATDSRETEGPDRTEYHTHKTFPIMWK